MLSNVKQALSYKCDNSSPEFFATRSQNAPVLLDFVASNVVTLFCVAPGPTDRSPRRKQTLEFTGNPA